MKTTILFIVGFLIGFIAKYTKKQERGFRVMSKEKQREIASKGGKAAQESGAAHRWDTDEAKEAGHKGGVVVSQDKEHMAAIGKLGGKKSKRRKRQESTEANEAE